MEQQRPAIQAYCGDLIDALLANPEVEVIEELGAPLPMMVIANMLGVGGGDMAAFKLWSDDIIGNLGPSALSGDESALAETNRAFDAYFSQRLSELRRRPEDNLLSALVHVETEAGRLSEDDLLLFCRLLLVAGNETTTGLIAYALRAFSEFPEALRRVRADLSLLPAAIEEALRFYSPFFATIRRPTSDVTLRGRTIPKDDRILVLLACANRDEDEFDRPDVFDVARSPNRHIAFGLGIHACIGAPLARLEADVALRTLLPRIARIDVLDEDAGDHLRPGGPKRLLMRFDLG